MGWRGIARSAIGTRHQKLQQPCQDYGKVVVLAAPKSRQDRYGVIIGAVADGAGSALHAEVGAQLVVATTLKYLVASEVLLQKQQRSWQSSSKPPSEELIHKLFTKAVMRSQDQLKQKAASEEWHLEDLASTLLAFLATPHWMAAMQIGDGFMVVRYGQSGDYQLLFQPDRGEFANQTTFVTATDALTAMQVKVAGQSPQFIAASTDGIERVALRQKDWAPFSPFFSPLEEYLVETPNPDTDDAYLVNFLTSERLSQKTDDDKTLILCRYIHQD